VVGPAPSPSDAPATEAPAAPPPPATEIFVAPPQAAVTQTQPAPDPTAPGDGPGSSTPTRPPAAPDPVATPEVDFQDLEPYRAALRSGYEDALQAVPGATRYDIQVAIDPDEPARLAGEQRVRYTNREEVPLDAIYFRLYPNLPGFGGSMAVERVILNGQEVEPGLETQGTALRVPLAPALAPGETADLTLRFEAGIPTTTDAGYGVFAFVDDVYALAGFYPTIPVYDDEGWNLEVAPRYGDATFTDAAFYQVHLTAPAELEVAASGVLLDSSAAEGGARTWQFAAGPMRDFYIAMSADYEVVSREVDGVQVNSYYRSDQPRGGELALGYAADSLRIFADLFGPYPYTELDVVATPTNAGGIEYPGIIVVAQGLYDGSSAFFEVATAHEVAHQWWYGLVGNDQLDEPWLDESLTNYSSYVYFEELYGPGPAFSLKQQIFEQPFRVARQQGWDRPVAGPVASFDERSYGAIVYGKGPLFFDAVREELGDEAFFDALRAYLEANRYEIGYPPELIAAFEETSGQSIDDLYRFWILGEGESETS
jgi:hypothetical protein